MAATAPNANGAPTRTRSRKPASDDYTAELVRGRVYGLIGRNGQPDQWFENGVTTPVDQATYERLMNAVDVQTIHDGEFGRVQRVRRKFAPRGPDGNVLPQLVEERYVDCVD